MNFFNPNFQNNSCFKTVYCLKNKREYYRDEKQYKQFNKYTYSKKVEKTSTNKYECLKMEL